MAKDYNKTIHLPQTDFPMRAGLPKREPALLNGEYEVSTYHKLMEHNAEKPSFVNPSDSFRNEDQTTSRSPAHARNTHAIQLSPPQTAKNKRRPRPASPLAYGCRRQTPFSARRRTHIDVLFYSFPGKSQALSTTER